MDLSRLEDLKVAFKRRQQEIKNDRSEVIHFLVDFIVEFKKYLDPQSNSIYLGIVTYEWIEKHLERQKDNLIYDFTFSISFGERHKPHVVVKCICKNNLGSTFGFFTSEKFWSLPPKHVDAPHEYIAVFDHIYESLKKQINESCTLYS